MEVCVVLRLLRFTYDGKSHQLFFIDGRANR